MKKKFKLFAVVALSAMISFSVSVLAQPDPGGGGDPGGGSGPPVGGGAPIDSGIVTLVALAIAYTIYRWFIIQRQRRFQEL
jgi:hypothetical protein